MHIINGYNEARFTNRTTKSGIILQECTQTGLCGLNLIRRNEAKDEYLITLTAKILGRNYHLLLNRDTIMHAIEAILQTKLLGNFNPKTVLQEAKVLLCHITKDLQLKQALEHYIRMLKLLHVNTKYSITDYKNCNGITFRKNTITARAKEYAKIYNKSNELTLAHNKNYREALSSEDLSHVFNHLNNKTRLELELSSVTKIRQYFRLPKGQPVKLVTLLTTSCKPLSDFIKALTKPIVLAPEVAQDKELYYSLTQKKRSLLGFAKYYNFDIPAIQYALQELYKSRPQSARNNLKEIQALVCQSRSHATQSTSLFAGLLTELIQAVE